jgi:hypothetical protein
MQNLVAINDSPPFVRLLRTSLAALLSLFVCMEENIMKSECKLCWFTLFYEKCENFDKEGCINGESTRPEVDKNE